MPNLSLYLIGFKKSAKNKGVTYLKRLSPCQFPAAEFEQIQQILEDYALAKQVKEVKDEKPLSQDEALTLL